jgi:hypothetical protein
MGVPQSSPTSKVSSVDVGVPQPLADDLDRHALVDLDAGRDSLNPCRVIRAAGAALVASPFVARP